MPAQVPLAGSERKHLPGATGAGELDPSAPITVTLVLRRRAPLPDPAAVGYTPLTSHELGARYGADPADISLVIDTLAGYGLTVAEQHPESRRVKVSGSAADMSSAFGTSLRMVSSPRLDGPGLVTHRYREGTLYLPAALGGVVTAVLGLDDRPAASPHFRPARKRKTEQASTSYTPPQVADAYSFPAGTDGTGETISIIELGGGFSTGDLSSYFSGLGITEPSVTAVSVDGSANSPGGAADGEVMLDIEVAGSVAPGAKQLVYFAPNTDQGFNDAIANAAHASPAPTAISISWGGSEDSWTAQARTAMDDAIADAVSLGVTVTCAAGDGGSSDGVSDGSVHVDFPASSPNALACGGTRLEISGSSPTETVWNDELTGGGTGSTGGGVSDTFPVPSWQAQAGVPVRASGSTGATTGRGVPDVAGNADPETGYQVLVDGSQQVYGGTSAVAPLWAALVARLAQAAGARFGLLQTSLYAGISPGTDVAGFKDITSGNNGAYSAGPGWDACTGLGSPNGTALQQRLGS